jgi:PAS domain-containing protein
MRASLARLPGAIVITDAVHGRREDSTIVFANEAFFELTGDGNDQLIGTSVRILLAGEPTKAMPSSDSAWACAARPTHGPAWPCAPMAARRSEASSSSNR